MRTRRLLLSTLLVVQTLSLSCTTASRKPASPEADDPYLWLEEIESEQALNWVRERSDRAVAQLSSLPRFKEIEPEIREIVLAKDRIPSPALRHGWLYNFWQDATHVKGVWRRVRPAEYEKPASGKDPSWEVLLDLDELSRAENENWVWKGSQCLPPAYERCLLSLSRGGKDAVVVREFDLATRSFVAGGFSLPEAKSRLSWIDADTVFVGTDFGQGSLTDAGYPRLVKRWKRGTPLSEAKLVFEGEQADVSVDGGTLFRPEGTLSYVSRRPSFFEEENHILRADGTLLKSPFPRDASFQAWFGGKIFVALRSDWKPGARTFSSGSLLALPVSRIGAPDFDSSLEVIFEPTERSSLDGVTTTRSALYLTILENVRGRVERLTPAGSKWKRDRIPFPDHGTVSITAAEDFDDRIYAQFESFLIPSSIYAYDGGKLRVARSLPKKFNDAGMIAEQFESVSKDGTRIPYFVIRKKSARLDGNNPTLLYGYGGFEVSQTPFYLGTIGKTWLERGGVYVLANIRGGGEFGPKWHQAALQKNRQVAFDDFISVAEDLIARKLTSPRRLAIQGGSNGGLLVGAVYVQRPELFHGVLCQVPLLDMMRYHKLLAGSSWMAEYGNPEDPAMGEIILKYSPYQNVRAGAKYPKVFVMTSTKDDRVHPGHARKMVARMEEHGHPIFYYENTEGGHGGAANLEQRIKQLALQYTYLFAQLAD